MYNEWSNNMNNKNKIVNVCYQLTTIIIELMFFIKYLKLKLLWIIKMKIIMEIIIINS